MGGDDRRQAHDEANRQIDAGGNDNEGFDFNEKAKAETLGLPLIKDLAEGICKKVRYPTLKSNYYEFEIAS